LLFQGYPDLVHIDHSGFVVRNRPETDGFQSERFFGRDRLRVGNAYLARILRIDTVIGAIGVGELDAVRVPVVGIPNGHVGQHVVLPVFQLQESSPNIRSGGAESGVFTPSAKDRGYFSFNAADFIEHHLSLEHADGFESDDVVDDSFGRFHIAFDFGLFGGKHFREERDSPESFGRVRSQNGSVGAIVLIENNVFAGLDTRAEGIEVQQGGGYLTVFRSVHLGQEEELESVDKADVFGIRLSVQRSQVFAKRFGDGDDPFVFQVEGFRNIGFQRDAGEKLRVFHLG